MRKYVAPHLATSIKHLAFGNMVSAVVRGFDFPGSAG